MCWAQLLGLVVTVCALSCVWVSVGVARRGVGRPRRHPVVKSYVEVEDEDEDERGGGGEGGEEEEEKGEGVIRGAITVVDEGSDTASDPLPYADEDESSLDEYERTHRLVMEPEMLPSGRPAVHHILAHRPIPPRWRTQSTASASPISSSSSSTPSAAVDDGPVGVDSAEESRITERMLAEMDPGVRVLVESSSLLMDHLNHHFFCTFKHMSFLHTAWLPLSALMEEGVKMKIKLSKYLRGDSLLLNGDDDEEEVREELIDSEFTCVDKLLAVRDARRRDDIEGVRRFHLIGGGQAKAVTSASSAQLPLHHHHPHQRASSSLVEQRSHHEYLCKWSSLPYSASTWERPSDFCDSLKIEQFEAHTAVPTEREMTGFRLYPTRPPAQSWKKLEEGVEYKGGNLLRPWQVEGVSWLLFNCTTTPTHSHTHRRPTSLIFSPPVLSTPCGCVRCCV